MELSYWALLGFLKQQKLKMYTVAKFAGALTFFFFFKKQHNFKFVWCILWSDVKMEQIPKVEGSP